MTPLVVLPFLLPFALFVLTLLLGCPIYAWPTHSGAATTMKSVAILCFTLRPSAADATSHWSQSKAV
uniref:Putative secreted protein n=1 Tax=Ixodes ricinus TaxID=34613 RepID=A0A147BS22_IXORI